MFAVCVRCFRVHFLGDTALIWAADKGNVEIAKELLKKDGININEKDSEGMKSGTFLVVCLYVDRCSNLFRVPIFDACFDVPNTGWVKFSPPKSLKWRRHPRIQERISLCC